MVVADVRDAEPRDAVEVALPVLVPEITAFGLGVDLIVADELGDRRSCGIHILRVECVILAESLPEGLHNVE